MTSLPVLEITKRSQEIFNIIVNNYLETGTPVGSGVISSHPELGYHRHLFGPLWQSLKVRDCYFHLIHHQAGYLHMLVCVFLLMG